MTSIVEAQRVNRRHGVGPSCVSALSEVSFGIDPGQFCALVGPSGSGKSTLLGLLGLLDRPTSGSVLFEGHDVTGASGAARAIIRNGAIGLIFQSFHLLPRLSALENVALPLLYQRCPLTTRLERARAALARVGLANRADHRPGALSGGQSQRVAIARAIVAQPRLLLADEPTGSLDTATAEEIMELLTDLNRVDGVAVVMVTHDPALARRCRRQVEMRDGRVVADSGA